MNPRWKRQWNITTVEIQERLMQMAQKWNGGNDGTNNGLQSPSGVQADTSGGEGQPDGQAVQYGASDQSTSQPASNV